MSQIYTEEIHLYKSFTPAYTLLRMAKQLPSTNKIQNTRGGRPDGGECFVFLHSMLIFNPDMSYSSSMMKDNINLMSIFFWI